MTDHYFPRAQHAIDAALDPRRHGMTVAKVRWRNGTEYNPSGTPLFWSDYGLSTITHVLPAADTPLDVLAAFVAEDCLASEERARVLKGGSIRQGKDLGLTGSDGRGTRLNRAVRQYLARDKDAPAPEPTTWSSILPQSSPEESAMREEARQPDPTPAPMSVEDALREAIEWLSEYSGDHLAWRSEEGNKKAQRNQERALVLQAALDAHTPPAPVVSREGVEAAAGALRSNRNVGFDDVRLLEMILTAAGVEIEPEPEPEPDPLADALRARFGDEFPVADVLDVVRQAEAG